MLASRLPLATGWGLVLSLATFWFLWITINMPLSVGERVVAKPIDYTRQIPDSEPVPKTFREKPRRELPPAVGPVDPISVPPVTPPRERARPDRTSQVVVDRPGRPDFVTGGSDGDAEPFYRVMPDYPISATARGIEGWVLVEFSIAASGRVTDVIVVDADPAGIFDKETIAAVQRWRYRPMVEGGRPVERVGMRTLLHFNLD